MATRTRQRAAPARSPVAEWIAATLGAVLTAAVLAYSAWEGLTDRQGPPELTVAPEAVVETPGGFVLPLRVRNGGRETAAAVAVRGVLELEGSATEERRTTVAYVPGGGEARGGLVFSRDPRTGRLDLFVEGYEQP